MSNLEVVLVAEISVWLFAAKTSDGAGRERACTDDIIDCGRF